MVRSTKVLLLVAAMALLAGPALADWDVNDGHKMHYPQLPDPTGWDVLVTGPKILADDWRCSESGPVTDVHFWGSWREGNVGEIESIHLSIHEDDLTTALYSMPGQQLWSYDVNGADISIVPINSDPWQGWFNPNTGSYNEEDHQNYFQYNIYIPEQDVFYQNADTIYWLDISATLEQAADGSIQPELGWKTSMSEHFMDDAVWGDLPSPLWGELVDPITGMSLDLAFVITPEPSTMAMLAIGGFVMLRRRRNR